MLEINGGSARGAVSMFLIAQAATTEQSGCNVAMMRVAFELLQATAFLKQHRRVCLASTAKISSKCVTRSWKSEPASEQRSGNMQFHLAAKQRNSMLVELFRQSWRWRKTINVDPVAQPSG